MWAFLFIVFCYSFFVDHKVCQEMLAGFPQLRLLIQQYFDIGGLRCFILRPIKSRFGSYQGTWQATEMWQSPLVA
jgi:hypothetical protein